jgi:peptidoglycan-N-acetylglucosamine deacetylase
MAEKFVWPDEKRAAISLSFDDARVSQIDVGMDVLSRLNVKATFYVTVNLMRQRLGEWKRAVADGHEIGNHTLTHPCSGNFSWSRNNALEDYTLERIESDTLAASEEIQKLLGVTPTTFAYPCGQKYVGRGESLKSYVPVISKHFVVGRGAFDEIHNDPPTMDLAQAFARDMDCRTFEQIKPQIDAAADEGGWLILLAHDVGEPYRQTITPQALDELCQYCMNPAHGLWIDTVAKVGTHVRNWCNGNRGGN